MTQSVIEWLHATNPPLATQLTKERIAAMQEIAALRESLEKSEKAGAELVASLQRGIDKARLDALEEAARTIETTVLPSHTTATLCARAIRALAGDNHDQ